MSEVPLWKGERENPQRTQIIQMKRPSYLSALHNSNAQIWPSSGHLRPVERQERWQTMAGRYVYDGKNIIDGSTARKRPHLKSEINYKWERVMYSDSTLSESREKQTQKSGSFIHNVSSIGNKLKKVKINGYPPVSVYYYDMLMSPNNGEHSSGKWL